MKPHDLWEPSQKGRLADWPQRQRATAGLLVGISNSVPRESMSLKGPSMTRGPFGRMRIVTSGIGRILAAWNANRVACYFIRLSDGEPGADACSGVRTNSTFQLSLSCLSALASRLSLGARCDAGCFTACALAPD